MPPSRMAGSEGQRKRPERPESEGRTAPAGRAAVDAGRASGLRDLTADMDAPIVPNDPSTAHGPLPTEWDLLPDGYRPNLLRWMKSARTEPARAMRIACIATSVATARRIPYV